MVNEFKVKGKELIEKIEELIKEGNARRIIIKDDKGKTFLEIPVNVGVLGAFFAPVLAAIGTMAALVADFTIQVIRKDEDAGADKKESPQSNFTI